LIAKLRGRRIRVLEVVMMRRRLETGLKEFNLLLFANQDHRQQASGVVAWEARDEEETR
jgi:hypothetical protein